MSTRSSSRESRTIWNELARWWDDNIRDGDIFHRTFVYPTVLKFSQINNGDKVLDIACGNGALSRFLGTSNIEIVAIDFSEKLIQCAIARSGNYRNIKYLTVDATDQDALRQLTVHGRFDTIICSMSLQDIWTIEPIISSLKYLITVNGKFIFSIPHPCFNSCTTKFTLPPNHSPEEIPSICISDYISCKKSRIKAKPNQPTSILSFHRPLSYIFNLLIKKGFSMDGFEEPVANNKLPNKFLWANFKKIPPAVISRWIIKKNIG